MTPGSGDAAPYELRLVDGTSAMRAAGARPVARRTEEDGPVAGALPFAASGDALLFRFDTLEWRAAPEDAGTYVDHAVPSAGEVLRIVAVPSRDEYRSRVRRLVDALRAHAACRGPLRKVVLARRLEVLFDRAPDPAALADVLRRDPQVTTFHVQLRDGDGTPARSVVGASPELLLDKRGGEVRSVPLAGSAARSTDEVRDREAARWLESSAKDAEEHRLVVEFVLDRLAPLCSELAAPKRPSLSATRTMWHLATEVRGRLRDPEVPSLALARMLHPTPAVCGVPTPEATRLIRELEPFERGLYAGAVGWSDGSGDGRWLVTLRCAEIEGSRAVLHAGAGILADSDPEVELAETSAKFRTLLGALGVAEEAAPAGGAR